MATCRAGNSNCGERNYTNKDECSKCGGTFYRCGGCRAIIPGSKSCNCGERPINMSPMKPLAPLPRFSKAY